MDQLILGMDLGSVSLDVVVFRGEQLLFHEYKRVNAAPRRAIAEVSKALLEQFPDGFELAMVTGSGKGMVEEILGIPQVNEIVAHGFAAARFAPEEGVISVIEIGGQDSKFITVDRLGPVDYAMNEVCAAGTGSFLDVQADRLGVTIEEFSRMAAMAKDVPPVAGRCSVFAKTDIIHLQQKGTPVDEIAAGLCFALARNYLSALVRGKQIHKPVIFQGGVAKNQGVVRAFKELLRLKDNELIIPQYPNLAGAIGSALLAPKWGRALDPERLRKAAEGGPKVQVVVDIKKGLSKEKQPSLEELKWVKEPEEGPFYIGVDVGSVSTDVVVVDDKGDLIGYAYLMTAGRPIEAISKAMKFIGERIAPEKIKGIGTTGSGRVLAGAILDADAVVDEITAQARGISFVFNDVDTIVEIGGQDSKYIQVKDQDVVDFEMNRACAAGTGSFLQEQAYRLSIDLKKDFADLAARAKRIPRLNSKCTVFMESDLVHHIQMGATKEELTAGLAYSVVKNYLETTASNKTFGKHIVLSGGVANNDAVVRTFAQFFKDARVSRHPNPGLSGAMGAAIVAMDSGNKEVRTDISVPENLEFSTFECTQCENLCEIKVYNIKGRKHYFGDLCGMYSERTSFSEKGRDLLEGALSILDSSLKVPMQGAEEVIGFPQAQLFKEYMVFYTEFFRQLGFRPVSSGPVTMKKLERGLQKVPAEFCLPVKVMFAQVVHLFDRGIEKVFVPDPPDGEDGMMCPYINGVAAAIQSALKRELVTFPLVPFLEGKQRDYLIQRAVEVLNRERSDVIRALNLAEEAQGAYRKVIETIPDPSRKTAVLIGKPYTVGDKFINLSLSSKLAKRGFDVIAAWQLPDVYRPDKDENMYATWQFSKRMVRAAKRVLEYPNAYPVIVTNFGCGPDAFTVPFIERELGDRPYIVLEFDEHRQDAGLETRLDAFNHRVEQWIKGRRPHKRPSVVVPKTYPEKKSVYYIPYFSPHAWAFSGALKRLGEDARVLDIPTKRVLDLGEAVSSGNECHPYKLITGDLIRLKEEGLLKENSAYIFPIVTTSRCIVTQYVPAMNDIIAGLGRPDVEVIGGSGAELLDRFGMAFVLTLDKALFAIDYFFRYKQEISAYATDKKLLEHEFNVGLRDIEEAIVNGDIFDGIDLAIKRLKSVPLDLSEKGKKPIIAVVGDVYTRVNPAANANLFNMLEDLGCEVWPAPTIVDVSLFGTQIEVKDYFRMGDYRSVPLAWAQTILQNLHLTRIRSRFEGLLTNLKDLNGAQIYELTKDIFPDQADLLVRLNVGEAIDFALKGVHGIINAFCQNCMVGTSSAAVFGKLQEKLNGVPIMSIVFSGQEEVHVRNRLEAFVYRTKRFMQENPRAR